MQYHPVADIFPMMAETELADLAADIEAHGLIEPIWTHKGLIIDGRNRYRACMIAEESPRYREYDGDEADLTSFVIGLNLKRRHLDASQRAVIGLAVERYEAERAKERQLANLKQGSEIPVREIVPQREEEGRARDFAAAAVGVNPRYIQEAKRIEREAPDLIPAIASGEMNIPQAKREIDERQGKTGEPGQKADAMAVHYSSETPEWYTPQDFTDLVLEVLGDIDLDPCSNSRECPNIPAALHFTASEDGLIQVWEGRVFMNPPYGRELSEWVSKLVSEFEAGRVTEAIALVPSRTDTAWFRELRDFPRCFINGRMKFSGYDNSAPFPSMAVYLGENVHGFISAFSVIGDTYVRIV